MDENILFVLNANEYLMTEYNFIMFRIMIMCDTIFSNSYSYILICFCSNLIVRIWFFLNGNLFLCYRFMLFLELSSQIDCCSLLDKNFLLTTLAIRNCLSCKNKHSIYILSLHVV